MLHPLNHIGLRLFCGAAHVGRCSAHVRAASARYSIMRTLCGKWRHRPGESARDDFHIRRRWGCVGKVPDLTCVGIWTARLCMSGRRGRCGCRLGEVDSRAAHSLLRRRSGHEARHAHVRARQNSIDSATCNPQALFLIMFALLVAYATATHFLGTHLWGCFIAGMSFACVPRLRPSACARPPHAWMGRASISRQVDSRGASGSPRRGSCIPYLRFRGTSRACDSRRQRNCARGATCGTKVGCLHLA